MQYYRCPKCTGFTGSHEQVSRHIATVHRPGRGNPQSEALDRLFSKYNRQLKQKLQRQRPKFPF